MKNHDTEIEEILQSLGKSDKIVETGLLDIEEMINNDEISLKEKKEYIELIKRAYEKSAKFRDGVIEAQSKIISDLYLYIELIVKKQNIKNIDEKNNTKMYS